jgi:hypothetical protein
MKRILTRLVKSGTLPLLCACLSVGMIDLLKARRNHDYADAIGVIVVGFILFPFFALRRRGQDTSLPDRTKPPI